MKTKKLISTAILAIFCCSLFAVNEMEVVNANAKTIKEMLDFAQKQQQKPFQEGAEGPNTFDCPGFCKFVFNELGIGLPKTTNQQASVGKKVKNKKSLKEGDLVFFSESGKKAIAYVGIVSKMKGGETFDFLYVSQSKGVTAISSEDSAFEDNFLYGSRVTSDKELNTIRKNYAKKQNEIKKAEKAAEKQRAELEKANKKAEKAKKDADKAKKKTEKANAALEKANKKK
jgi:hypothetical protein